MKAGGPLASIVRRYQNMTDTEIESALRRGQLSLVLQPIVGSLSFRPAFYEALLRLQMPDGSIRRAQDFIGPAERSGLVGALDSRALELAIALLSDHPAFELALNISSLTTSDFNWIRQLDTLTLGSRGHLRRLIVEITETAAITDIDRTLTFIDTLREMGCRIAVDDFGAGHTSRSMLLRIAPDIVKIDGKFAAGASMPGQQRDFFEGVVALSREMHFETVGEGIESEATAQAIADLGVTYMQGYFFGSPDNPVAALTAK